MVPYIVLFETGGCSLRLASRRLKEIWMDTQLQQSKNKRKSSDTFGLLALHRKPFTCTVLSSHLPKIGSIVCVYHGHIAFLIIIIAFHMAGDAAAEYRFLAYILYFSSTCNGDHTPLGDSFTLWTDCLYLFNISPELFLMTFIFSAICSSFIFLTHIGLVLPLL